MAFKKAPEQDTYSTVEFPLFKEMNSRDYTQNKDVDYLNIVFDFKVNKLTQQQELTLQKRCGSSTLYTGAVLEDILMMYVWNFHLVIVNTAGDLKTISLDTGTYGTQTTRLTNMWGSAPTRVGYTEFTYVSGTNRLLITNGAVIKEINTSWTVSATINDADLPAHDVNIVALDGYVFVARSSDGSIYNSDLDNPSSWTAGNFISPDQYPNQVVYGLFVLNNYIVFSGGGGFEFFYNAGVATGSPLQRNTSLAKRVKPLVIGTLLNHFIKQIGDSLLFLGNAVRDNDASGIHLYALSVDNLEQIEHPILNQKLGLLQKNTSFNSGLRINSIFHPGNGRVYACISMPALVNSTAATFIFDLKTKLLFRWSFALGNVINAIQSPATTWGDSFSFVLLESTNGNTQTIILLDPTLNQDSGSDFTFTIVTDLEDFDTINRKTMSRLVLVGEKPASTASVSVSWTNDDYQNFNTPITVDMFQDLPSIQRLGQFRRRAFKIEGTHAQPFSLSRLEVDINKGNT